ncbi:MAG: Uma2 family endonuclease [Prosthecobacter sp.]|uniref:Uma2 family endonuclease n=1 Tax=Prosthecobacter sp. TaxID=1965333 RepID=UPI0038FEA224
MPAVLDPPRRKRPAALPPLAAPHDHLTVVWDTTWPFYLQLDAKLEGSSSRVSYLKGRLDLMTLSIDHERIKNTLHDLIVSHCQDEEVEYASQGAATLRIPRDRGKEPDDSFVFGELKKTRPDMVLEVVITSGAIDNLEFYAPFRIPEVWVWESSGLNVFILDGGRYRKAKKSKLLPKFNVALAGSLATCQSTSQAVREFRQGR